MNVYGLDIEVHYRRGTGRWNVLVGPDRIYVGWVLRIESDNNEWRGYLTAEHDDHDSPFGVGRHVASGRTRAGVTEDLVWRAGRKRGPSTIFDLFEIAQVKEEVTR